MWRRCRRQMAVTEGNTLHASILSANQIHPEFVIIQGRSSFVTSLFIVITSFVCFCVAKPTDWLRDELNSMHISSDHRLNGFHVNEA